jgi:hypothetical protein
MENVIPSKEKLKHHVIKKGQKKREREKEPSPFLLPRFDKPLGYCSSARVENKR